ncbi:sugar ABC transporter permease [Bosea thiooxidans]|nr:sugar ABC transporter permease [Bosea thiooxidans]
MTIVIYLYQAGFQYVELGYAAAVSYVLTLMIVAIAIVQKLLSGREVA